MLNAIFRLLAITLGTLFVTAFAIIMVRWAGLRQQYTAPAHPWFEMSTWEFRQPTPSETCDKGTAIAGDGIAWLKLKHQDGKWQMNCPEGSLTFAEKIATSPQKNWLIEVAPVDLEPLDILIEALTPMDKQKNFAIYSGSQRVARYVRKKSPQWLFAADAASLIRLHLFSSFWIETILEFWPDFVLQIPEDKTTHLNTREVQELERRQKRVIVLPNSGQ